LDTGVPLTDTVMIMSGNARLVPSVPERVSLEEPVRKACPIHCGL
jgi:hypothetical protein